MSITITNNLKNNEPAYSQHSDSQNRDVMNPGSQSGPKKSNTKFNDLSVPIPGTNFQMKVDAGSSHTSAPSNLIQSIFYNKVVGNSIPVTVAETVVEEATPVVTTAAAPTPTVTTTTASTKSSKKTTTTTEEEATPTVEETPVVEETPTEEEPTEEADTGDESDD